MWKRTKTNCRSFSVMDKILYHNLRNQTTKHSPDAIVWQACRYSLVLRHFSRRNRMTGSFVRNKTALLFEVSGDRHAWRFTVQRWRHISIVPQLVVFLNVQTCELYDDIASVMTKKWITFILLKNNINDLTVRNSRNHIVQAMVLCKNMAVIKGIHSAEQSHQS